MEWILFCHLVNRFFPFWLLSSKNLAIARKKYCFAPPPPPGSYAYGDTQMHWHVNAGLSFDIKCSNTAHVVVYVSLITDKNKKYFKTTLVSKLSCSVIKWQPFCMLFTAVVQTWKISHKTTEIDHNHRVLQSISITFRGRTDRERVGCQVAPQGGGVWGLPSPLGVWDVRPP